MAIAETGELIAPTPTLSGDRLPWRLAAFTVRFYWLWPTLLMLLACAYKLGNPSLWADELATWGAVRMDWSPLFRLLGNVDAVVAPYYVVTKAWAAVAGTSPVALRVPSVLAMTAAAGFVALLGARLHSRWVGLLAGLTFALTPATSRYGQEARPYAFAVLFAVVATLLLVRYVDRPGFATGVPYALAIALLGAFHVLGLLLLVAHAVAVRHRLLRWAVWAGAGLVPLLPLFWLGYLQRGQVAWIPPAHLHVILGAPDVVFVSADVAGAMVALGLLGFARRPNAVLLASWALVPFAVLALVGQFAPLFYARYLLYSLPAWVLLVALALDRLSRTQALVVTLVVAVLGAPTQNAIRDPDGHSTASSLAGAVIARNELPGDAIAYKLNETAPWFTRDVVARYVPAAKQPLDVFQVVPQRVDAHLAAVECANLTACLDAANPARMWVVRRNTQPDPLLGIGQAKDTLLRARYHMLRLWLLKGLTIALYVRN
ncbi:MAG TPA: glycosyltransferase family 39 protein [Rugosimonospora sp.]|nr:glycosyltransferase family 39 protein [Rugosimonospora sp.]